MSQLVCWISSAARVGLDHAMRSWTKLAHRWEASLSSVIGSFVAAWAVGSSWGDTAASEPSRNGGNISLPLRCFFWLYRGSLGGLDGESARQTHTGTR
jgi:hypothetical protein